MRVVFRVLLAVAAGLVGMTFAPTPAQAAPTACSATLQDNTVRAKCKDGTGQVRAVVDCYVIRTDAVVRRFGRWVNAGGISTVSCAGAQVVDHYWYETTE